MAMSAKWLGAVLALGFASSAGAAVTIYSVDMDGIKEAAAGTAGNGDPDGRAIGTLQLDSGTGGNTGSATVNLTFTNLDVPFTGFHIHAGGPTATGPILVNFGTPETYRTGNVIAGTIPNLSSTDISTVQANPGNFYFNIHNGSFPAGAVRDQLPEPAGLSLLALGGLFLGRRRRRSV